jgi:hypothetical protein
VRCAGQLVLELCDGAEDLKNHAAVRRIGAQPFHERAESGHPFRPAGPPPSRSLSERLRRGSRRTTSTSPARMWESASALGFVSRLTGLVGVLFFIFLLLYAAGVR